jgi:hypothetical protein
MIEEHEKLEREELERQILIEKEALESSPDFQIAEEDNEASIYLLHRLDKIVFYHKLYRINVNWSGRCI